MGNGRKLRKQVPKETKLPNNPTMALAELLGDYYEFLSKEEKPSDQEVRDRFIEANARWKKYCVQKSLTYQSQELFKINVAKMWEHNKQKSQTDED